jgi:hypothetical protein
MKCPLYAMLMLILASSAVLAQQIPNAGFETWSSGNPENWATSNAPPIYTNVTKSTTAHGGSASVRGDVVSILGSPVNIQPTLQSGPTGEGFAISSRPAAITGWYQFTSVNGDRFGVNVALFKGGVNGTVVANAAIADPTSRITWYQFNVPFIYVSAETPDVCIIQHQIISPTGPNPSIGSYFLLDDLAFGPATGIGAESSAPRAFALHQNYPNPFNPSTVITYDLPAAANVRLTVFNLLGQEVATVVQERMDAGTHHTSFNGAGLPSGMYLVRLQADGFTQTRSMLLVR